MKAIQRTILVAGALLVLTIGSFPPHVLVLKAVEPNQIRHPQKVVPVGYWFIFSPPPAIELPKRSDGHTGIFISAMTPDDGSRFGSFKREATQMESAFNSDELR